MTGAIGGVQIQYHMGIPDLPYLLQHRSHLRGVCLETVAIEIEAIIVGAPTDGVGTILVSPLAQPGPERLVAIDVVDRHPHRHQILHPGRTLSLACLPKEYLCRLFSLDLAAVDVGLDVDHRSARCPRLGPIGAGGVGQHHHRNFKTAGTGAQGRDGDGGTLALQLGDELLHIGQ